MTAALIHIQTARPRRLVVPAILLLAATGCGDAAVGIKLGKARHDDPRARITEQLRADPVAYMNDLLPRLAGMAQYRLLFCRQERLGLAAVLHNMERIDATYRRDPLAIKFIWRGEEGDYREAVFVKGTNDDRVMLLPRRGFLGLPPKPMSFAPELAITFGRARNAMTDFGLHRMIQRTLARIDNARTRGDVTVEYAATQSVEDIDAHVVRIHYPPGDGFPNNRQDLYFETETGLPIGTSAWLPDGGLDATYLYLNLKPVEAPLTNDDFKITPTESTES